MHIAILVPTRGIQPATDRARLRRRVGHLVPHLQRLRALRRRAQVLGAADPGVAGPGTTHLDPRGRAARPERGARQGGSPGETDGLEPDQCIRRVVDAPTPVRTLRQLRRPGAARGQPVHLRRRRIGRGLARGTRQDRHGDNRVVSGTGIPRVEPAETDQAGGQRREKAREPPARSAALPIRVRGMHHRQQDPPQRRAPGHDHGEPSLAERGTRGHGARRQHALTGRVLDRHQPNHLDIRHRFALPTVGFTAVGDDPRNSRGRVHNPGHRGHRAGD